MKLVPAVLAAAAALLAVASLLFAQSAPESKASAKLKGTAFYRERIAMQPGAVLEAALVDVSKAGAPAQVIATARIENPGNPPYSFSLEYDPAKIVESHSYSVRATITLDGKLIFTSTQSYPVITRGNSREVNIVLHSVPASPHSDATSGSTSEPKSHVRRVPVPPFAATHSLERTDWKLTRLGDQPVTTNPDQPAPDLILNPGDHRVSGSGGCNRMMGTYTLDGQSLRFGAMATTMMACANGMDQEHSYLRALDSVRTWKINANQLELSGEGGKVLAVFESHHAKGVEAAETK